MNKLRIIEGLFLIIFVVVGSSAQQPAATTETIELTTSSSLPISIDRSSHHHHHAHADPTYEGIWKKKFVWRPRWVKTWQAKKIYVAVWKRMWGPAEVKEWVPIPKPPPGWVKPNIGPVVIKKFPH